MWIRVSNPHAPSSPPRTVAAKEPGQYNNSTFAQRVASSRLSQRLATGSSVLDDSFLTGADTLTHKSRGGCCVLCWVAFVLGDVLGGVYVCLHDMLNACSTNLTPPPPPPAPSPLCRQIRGHQAENPRVRAVWGAISVHPGHMRRCRRAGAGVHVPPAARGSPQDFHHSLPTSGPEHRAGRRPNLHSQEGVWLRMLLPSRWLLLGALGRHPNVALLVRGYGRGPARYSVSRVEAAAAQRQVRDRLEPEAGGGRQGVGGGRQRRSYYL